ncbi:hypothetical protein ACFL5D_00035 [Candidatus Neomarinimicrobiota bacterium]
MNYKQIPIYLCSFSKEWNKRTQKEGSIAGHEFGKLNGKDIIWPKNADSETINPKNFIKLKKQFKLEELLFIDKLIGTDNVVSIINHINRSGQNFLRGATPEGKYPQFPDMSKIYNNINGQDTVVVHTLGCERFKNISSNEKVIWSEAVGLIAPIAHYVGIKIYAIGGNNFVKIKQYIENI